MKYVFLYLFLLCITSVLPAVAQNKRFVLPVGVGGISAYHYDGFMLNVEPRLNLYKFSDQSGLSVGTSLATGFGISNKYRYNGESAESRKMDAGYRLSIPVTVNYTFGNGATPVAFKKFGYSAGIGYGVHIGGSMGYPRYKDSSAVTVSGLVLDAKFNFPLRNTSWSLHPSYMFNYDTKNPDITGLLTISLQYNLGQKIYPKSSYREYREIRAQGKRYQHEQ
ncbi:MAG: hypothetical protein J7623_18240 [Chitinophaga sp.]|uniref:hypothetical protein n=1 Tax=Chitinophaga sp. TaxID=1869181 RepID=UPI001B2D880C|nr:hypothetical protein [Chitinophaga sp.]MBO9730588.1 hypothetical protein [Chitinophaga sp.]